MEEDGKKREKDPRPEEGSLEELAEWARETEEQLESLRKRIAELQEEIKRRLKGKG